MPEIMLTPEFIETEPLDDETVIALAEDCLGKMDRALDSLNFLLDKRALTPAARRSGMIARIALMQLRIDVKEANTRAEKATRST